MFLSQSEPIDLTEFQQLPTRLPVLPICANFDYTLVHRICWLVRRSFLREKGASKCEFAAINRISSSHPLCAVGQRGVFG
ncbi:hypothetical protein E0H35_03520 [Rhizobium leguminosarum bv. viciae]|nr:hypothetical protein [Rhizobium leguminosarum bv. viciae]TBZ04189.1 hypothetical protein E0H35_03520 [Rhizobium leguminosarum bv. viciae]